MHKAKSDGALLWEVYLGMVPLY